MPRLRRSMFILSLLLLGMAGACWWAGNEIASPARRPLQDYHKEFLADPAAHGVSVKPFTISDGTPCLMMEPLTHVGQRGAKVREQLTAQNLTLRPEGEIIGTLVLVHGRHGRKEDYLLIGERLCAVGFRCLLPDMPAHGDHPKSLITFGIREAGLPALVLKEAGSKFFFDPQPAGLLGMSMGGAVAIHSAAQPSAPWETLIVVSSFDRLDTTIQSNVSRRVGAWIGHLWSFGAAWVYQQKTGVSVSEIRSDLPAAKLNLPVMMAHGTADRVIPLSSGQRLYSALPKNLTQQWVDVPGADHHNVLITDFPIYATIAHWMLHHVK
jgi:uncharacterized protein